MEVTHMTICHTFVYVQDNHLMICYALVYRLVQMQQKKCIVFICVCYPMYLEKLGSLRRHSIYTKIHLKESVSLIKKFLDVLNLEHLNRDLAMS